MDLYGGFMNEFNFKKFWLSLSFEERKTLANEAGTTANYIMMHVQRREKIPERVLMCRLFEACERRNPGLEKAQFLAFFY